MKCNYCNKEAEWVENKAIYKKNYGKSYMIWWCKPCDAYVGCHNNTKDPLGSLANKELRELRKQSKQLWIVTENIDWKDSISKKNGYRKLRKQLGYDFHFGESTLEECNKIIKLYDTPIPAICA